MLQLMTQSRTDYLAKRREYRQLHRDELNVKKRLWHAEHKTDQNEKSLAYFDAHRGELLEKNREYKADHRAEMSGYLNEWRGVQREPGGKIYQFRLWLYTLKSDPCVDCGNTFPTCAMDWDHVRGKKLFNIGNVRGMSDTATNRSRALEEIAKCDLVCACCHRVRTKNRQGAGPGQAKKPVKSGGYL